MSTPTLRKGGKGEKGGEERRKENNSAHSGH